MKVKAAAMQAYPFIEPADDPAIKAYHPGMTLRDYFAAKAMQGLIVDPERVDHSRQECARLSYAMADAMMEARK